MEYHIRCCNCKKETSGHDNEPSTPKTCEDCGEAGHDMVTGNFEGWGFLGD